MPTFDFIPLVMALAWSWGWLQFLQQEKRPLSGAFSPQEIWRTLAGISGWILGLGWLASAGRLMVPLYHARYWCLLIAVLLAIILWLGSIFHIRLAFFTGTLVLLGLEIYSAVAFKGQDEALDAAFKAHPAFEALLKGFAVFCCALCCFVLARRLSREGQGSVNILSLLVKEDPKFAGLPARERIWKALGIVSIIALFVGATQIGVAQLVEDSDDNFLFSLYREGTWCVLIAACLVVIFFWGSFPQRRLAGILGVLVFGGLEIASLFAWHPPVHWILVGYAGFCLGLSLRVLEGQFHPHHPDAVHTR